MDLRPKTREHLYVERAMQEVATVQSETNISALDGPIMCIAIQTSNEVAGHAQIDQSELRNQEVQVKI